MHTYIIAEVGQNHNGSLELAKKLIDMAAMPIYDYFSQEMLPGVDAVKFTKRDLSEEMTREEARRPYTSPHAFGPTYMEHRQTLELSFEEHIQLEEYAHSKGLDFVETLCSPSCLALLDRCRVDAVKIASRDITNIPLLEALSEYDHRIILSTGMCTPEELHAALKVLASRPRRIDILHCLSEYPANHHHINLRSIDHLRKLFPNHIIGYSDHSIGIILPVVAVTLGAEIIEKHITLNRNMKGSDHYGALEPEGLWRMVRNIRVTELSLGKEEKTFNPAAMPCREKLARSLCLRHDISKGQVVREQDLCMLSPGTGLSWDQRSEIIGRRAIRDLPGATLIKPEDFEWNAVKSNRDAETYAC